MCFSGRFVWNWIISVGPTIICVVSGLGVKPTWGEGETQGHSLECCNCPDYWICRGPGLSLVRKHAWGDPCLFSAEEEDQAVLIWRHAPMIAPRVLDGRKKWANLSRLVWMCPFRRRPEKHRVGIALPDAPFGKPLVICRTLRVVLGALPFM